MVQREEELSYKVYVVFFGANIKISYRNIGKKIGRGIENRNHIY